MKGGKMTRKSKGKATVVITYNSVADYPAGTYQGRNGPVIIYSHDNVKTWGVEDANEKLNELLHSVPNRSDSKSVDQVYFYIGKYAMEGALRAAQRIAGDKTRLTLVACDCEEEYKRNVANHIGASIIWSDCGGRRTLKDIVSKLM